MFYGRERELASLSELWDKAGASLVVCRGRRRIGKSTLIEEFARVSKARLVKFEGLAPRAGMSNSLQLEAFGRQLGEQTDGAPSHPGNWFDAFRALDSRLRRKSRTVVLLDEISWMGKYDASFPGELKYAWDNRFKRHANAIFVLCGSVSSWIGENIVNSTAFFGRISRDMIVGELGIADAVKFWGARAERITAREIIDVLSVTGGVPKYLEDINPAFSADENIRRLCFRTDGQLFSDFREIFNSVFGESTVTKKAILEKLASGPLSCSELADALHVPRGGKLERNLADLEVAGFVARSGGMNPETGKISRKISYRLKDNYTRFYLKYIEPHEEQILNGGFEGIELDGLPEWNAVMGLQFENLILNNLTGLLPRLHLAGVPVLSAAPFRKVNARSGGCQIDLLIQTRKALFVVEIKRKKEIGEEVEREVAAKVARLSVPVGKSIRTALVYDGELLPVVRANAYFDALVGVGDLIQGERK
ncbi:MAG: AAA family ATPase [Kiritimatiellae bacterium]|nr:AAA family ATPase [Kiritimatiellia bacterium]